MSILHAILLGILQGLTEFLPVSSSGHLAIAQHFLPGFEQPGVLFDVLLHVGTILAVLIAFRREVWQLARAPFARDEDARAGRRMLFLLVAASVPTAIIGLAFKDFFDHEFCPAIGIGTTNGNHIFPVGNGRLISINGCGCKKRSF